MKNILYNEFAGYYAAMSNHRNFEGQLDYILGNFNEDHPCRNLMELFAGQSQHSIAALKKGTINVWAVDSSMEMKRMALAGGFKDAEQYIVGNLPNVISNFKPVNKFDCILCLYHGLSNLKIESVYGLLKRLKKLLNKKGKIFIEIHNIFKIMEYIETPQVFKENLQIESDKMVQYSWPSGKIRWSPYSFSAEVPVKIYISSSVETETMEFISKDRVYSAEDILFMAGILGYNARILTDEDPGREYFGYSVLLELSLPERKME